MFTKIKEKWFSIKMRFVCWLVAAANRHIAANGTRNLKAIVFFGVLQLFKPAMQRRLVDFQANVYNTTVNGGKKLLEDVADGTLLNPNDIFKSPSNASNDELFMYGTLARIIPLFKFLHICQDKDVGCLIVTALGSDDSVNRFAPTINELMDKGAMSALSTRLKTLLEIGDDDALEAMSQVSINTILEPLVKSGAISPNEYSARMTAIRQASWYIGWNA